MERVARDEAINFGSLATAPATASVADMKYTLYLLRKGLDLDEIRRRLLSESLLIEKRKKGHLNDYLDRTIFRAKSYLQQS